MKIAILFFVVLVCLSCTNDDKSKIANSGKELITLASGLQYRVLQEGLGREAKAGDTVLIFETVRYSDSTLIFSNENSDRAIRVLIGGGQATEGEDEGLRGMKEGEIREMIIPPALSRRKSYPPNLSPDSTIIVKVILEKIL